MHKAFPLPVIKFPLAEEVPTANITAGDKSGRTLTLTAEDMQRKKNDVKARTTLLLSLLDKHQLRFSKYKIARDLWAAILKMFGGNEATKKTKKNLLKQQYGNFKAEGSETLEQTFNRLQVIVGQLQFMDVEIEQDDLNQKFLTTKHNGRNKDGNTASVPTASTNVPIASASVATISQDTACAYIASQSSGSQIKFEDINQIDEDDIEEMDIKWNMALLSMRGDKFWKKTCKKISIHGSDVVGFDKSKVECFNYHKMGHFARECRAPRSQDRGRRDNFRQVSKAEEQAPKALMAIDGVGWDWSYMENDEEDHALVADEVAPTEFALMANTNAESKVFENSLCSKDYKKNNDSLNSKITDLTDKLFDANNFIYYYKLAFAQVESRLVEYKEREVKYIEKIRTLEYYSESYKECNDLLKKKLETLQQEKEGVDGKLTGLLTALKDLDNLIESQRSKKNKEGLGYTAVPPPTAQLYLSPKKDLSWIGLPECVDDTVTDYSRPSPTTKSISEDDQNRNTSVSKTVASPITSKPFIKFVRPKDSQSDSKTDKKETPKKPSVKYAEQYRKPNMKPKARGNQRNWNNLKSQQLGPDFVMKKKACFNCVRSPSRAPWVPTVNRNYSPLNRKFSTGSRNFPTANRKFPTASRKFPLVAQKNLSNKGPKNNSVSVMFKKYTYIDIQGRPKNMTCNISYLSDFEPYDGGYVSFGQRGCKITGKGTIKTYNANILLRTPMQHNMYSINLNNIIPHIDLTCLVAKASADECMLWHRRLGHLNFKTMNKLVRHNLVRGLPTKCFENDHTCTACLKGKQHKASLTDDFSRFTWTFFLTTKDETSGILKKFITEIENLKDLKVKIIRVLVNKSHNKTPYELFNGRSPAIGFLRPFGCHVMILNTLDNLGKFVEKGDECYFIGYSMSSKAFRVFNKRTRRVEENSLDAGTISTNLLNTNDATSQEVKKDVSSLRYIALPNWAHDALLVFSLSKPQDHCSTEVPEGSGNTNPTASALNPPADHMETLTVESLIPTVLKNKKDERGIVIRNKARLVAQGHNQEERINYDEVFAPVVRIEAIRLFLAYASFIGFTVYQMDVKSAFLYGTIDEEVYVMQHLGFQDLEFPAKVYKVEKAIKKREDFILVQVYMDDIIFRSSNPQLCREFEALMHDKFQMSAMGELNFFLGLQVLQKEDGIFLSQDKYVRDTLKKFRYSDVRSMIGSLMYLIASRPDIMFAVCACARRLISWQCKKKKIMATLTTEAEYAAAASCRGQVLWIQNQLLDYGHHVIKDCFEKKLINVDHIHTNENVTNLLTKRVDAGRFQYLVYKLATVSVFLGFGLTFAGTSKYWGVLRILMIGLRLIPLGEHNTNFHPMVDFLEASPLRIKTTKEETKILATIDDIVRTVFELSLRRNLKLRDEEGISSLPNAVLFENLTLMGYNISPNQKFTFQKGQFSHQWKYIIHTIMQCLSPKSTGFNEFSSNIATALVCLATNRTYNFSKMIFDGLVKNVNNKVLKFLMYPRFLTMCLRMSQFGQITHTQTYVVPFHTKKLFTTLWVNSPSFSGRTVPLFAAMLVYQGEGSGTPTEPHQTPSSEAQTPSHTTHPSSSLPPITTTSIPTVTTTETTPIRQYTRRTRIAQSSVPLIDRATIDKSSTLPYDTTPWVTSPDAVEGMKINRLKERIKQLEEREGVAATNSRYDAPIKRRSMNEGEAATERVSDDIEEMATVLTSMDAATVLTSGVVDVPTGSGSIPTASTLAEGSVPTGSEEVPTASPVFATATVVTPVTRRKGKEVMVESETPKKQKVQKQIDAQVARELEEQLAREDQRRAEQIARDAEIARIHAEEELQIMISGLDRNNETIAKYLEEYQQFSSELPMERRIELISDLVKDFRGMTFEEVEAKFNSVCKQMEDFILMGSKEEAKRIKRKGINLEQESAKKQKSSEEITEEAKSHEEVTEEKVHSKGQRSYWKITRLGGSSACYQFIDLLKHLDREDLNQLWKLVKETLNNRPPSIEWMIYDSCGVHHVAAKDKEIFMLVEKDYPLRKGLALVMICYKLQVENFSQMANELVLKIYRIANSPRQQEEAIGPLLVEDGGRIIFGDQAPKLWEYKKTHLVHSLCFSMGVSRFRNNEKDLFNNTSDNVNEDSSSAFVDIHSHDDVSSRPYDIDVQPIFVSDHNGSLDHGIDNIVAGEAECEKELDDILCSFQQLTYNMNNGMPGKGVDALLTLLRKTRLMTSYLRWASLTSPFVVGGSLGSIRKQNDGSLTDADILKREEWLMDLSYYDQLHKEDLKQKRRLKWAVEGDENTRFFHSIIKNRYDSFSIKGYYLEACNKGIFKDISLAKSGTNISLLQYMDDALFFRERSRFNDKNLTHIIKCFELGSGLRMNFLKSMLSGIGIPSNEVEAMVSSLGCAHDVLPFIYLGLPVVWVSDVSIQKTLVFLANGNDDFLPRKMLFVGSSSEIYMELMAALDLL
uniref:Retrovirus-related Pol polyprotein from transposon TNT 1-94 n=1 Tax=Tanacetum cinerariifolium TaxID=118510 RepID=A0A6L2P809_TANCI|nr:retrovirus-related Pol polyprotein from transposon TNT 1-94 [Tanacetum cinerariifolium]